MPNLSGQVLYAIAAVVIGIAVAVQALINPRLAQAGGSNLFAALISFSVGMLGLATVVLLRRESFAFAGAASGPWWLWIGGLLGATYIFGAIMLLPRMTATRLFLFVILGQVTFLAIAEAFGWFGAPRDALTWRKAGGILLMLAGTFIARWK